MSDDRPGSDGEHRLQERLGTRERADGFYERSMHDHLTPRMAAYLDERIMFFLATADRHGETDCSPRLGPPGFVNVFDFREVAYPEYRGNGVHASLGNIEENPSVSLTSWTGGTRPWGSTSTGRRASTTRSRGPWTLRTPTAGRCG
jgi:predicted pyridoxine 5'-phosphate oxidase superfamily flavin-nucleotide-binding protein